MKRSLLRQQASRPIVSNVIRTLLFLSAATGICILLRMIDNRDTYVPMLFILFVFLVARYTDGFWYGVGASLAGVLLVNYLFTYPYFNFNFTLAGYPITILCMLVVSTATSMLTTQNKRQEQIRIEAEKEKTRSNLLRAVSHDLRTPLTSILGAISAVIEKVKILGSEERLNLLHDAQDDARWLIKMVENLLTITRIDADENARLYKEPEAVEELIASAAAKHRKRFGEPPLSVSIPSELLMVPMDAVLIEQVITNLLENAVLHAKGANRIMLSVRREDSNAVFEVSDNGAGIPEKLLPHIFDGYFRQNYEEEGDSKRNMGIGLSVCETIVRAHNGTMSAFNKEGGGAVFRFVLPLGEEY